MRTIVMGRQGEGKMDLRKKEKLPSEDSRSGKKKIHRGKLAHPLNCDKISPILNKD